ncbi:hypothetical protein [Dasania marina]|uniref:hypothetical protein n=1 Tax=Dasania marina TaxID=471499 RepID=UPI0030DBF23F
MNKNKMLKLRGLLLELRDQGVRVLENIKLGTLEYINEGVMNKNKMLKLRGLLLELKGSMTNNN